MPSAPLDTIEYVLEAARERLNDMIQSTGGDVLTDTAPFTDTVVNTAYRRMQRKLASLGYSVLEQEFILANLPPVFAADQATQVWIDWTGYWNGQSLNTAFALPSWFISPLDCFERLSGSPTPTNFLDMDQQTTSLPGAPQQMWNLLWQWYNQRIYMPGALTNTDLRVRGASYLPDFTDIAADNTQLVPIVQCSDAFSWYIVVEMCGPRGDLDAKSAELKADLAAAMIADRQLQGPRRLAKASEAAKMADRLTPGPQGAPVAPPAQ